MAGSGVALRLHEFKETQDTKTHPPKHIVRRQGRDVQGLYPGQVARVHTISSLTYRSCLQSRGWLKESSYQRSFDLLTLRSLLQADPATDPGSAQTTPRRH